MSETISNAAVNPRNAVKNRLPPLVQIFKTSYKLITGKNDGDCRVGKKCFLVEYLFYWEADLLSGEKESANQVQIIE